MSGAKGVECDEQCDSRPVQREDSQKSCTIEIANRSCPDVLPAECIADQKPADDKEADTALPPFIPQNRKVLTAWPVGPTTNTWTCARATTLARNNRIAPIGPHSACTLANVRTLYALQHGRSSSIATRSAVVLSPRNYSAVAA